MACVIGVPFFLKQTVVSLWFVIPIAAMFSFLYFSMTLFNRPTTP